MMYLKVLEKYRRYTCIAVELQTKNQHYLNKQGVVFAQLDAIVKKC